MKKCWLQGLWLLVCGVAGIGIVLVANHTGRGRALRLPTAIIRVPVSPRRPGKEELQLPVKNERELSAIRAFLEKMDSLQKDSSGKAIYDSICRARPRLMDNARELEQYYATEKSQFKIPWKIKNILPDSGGNDSSCWWRQRLLFR